MRKRILRFYMPLKRLGAEVVGDQNFEHIEGQLSAMEQIASDPLKVRVHKKLLPDFYAFRSDIDFVRTLLTRLHKGHAISPKEEQPESA